MRYIVLLAVGEEEPCMFHEVRPPVLCGTRGEAEAEIKRIHDLAETEEVDWCVYEVVDGKCQQRTVVFKDGHPEIQNQSALGRTEVAMDRVITYADDGSRDLEIPLDEARLCALYRDPGTSEVSAESYLLCGLLAEEPTPQAEIICNGATLAGSPDGARWTLTPAGQGRLA